MTVTDAPQAIIAGATELQTPTVIYVCTTCRKPGDPADAPRLGASLAAAAVEAAQHTEIVVRPMRCLGNCNRGCSAAMRSANAWTYVFGDLNAGDSHALIQGARLLAASADGLMPWRGRPEVLKRGLIARVPPIDFAEKESK